MKKLIIAIISVFLLVNAQAQITTPSDYFKFKPGTDGELFDYEQLIGYFQMLDQESSKLALFHIGESPMGKPMYVACISSSENIENLTKLKEYNRELALNPDLSEQEVNEIVQNGKVFVLATLSMHSTEVAPAQASPLIAYELLTTTDKRKQKWMEDVVFMVVPNHNPDGMDMVVEHWRKYKGSKYEGASMPGIYHKYVGHDNNRDFVILSQTDTKAISGLTSTDWFPQVMVEKHQMGSTGPRYFVPPTHDPIAENIDAGIFNWTGLFGQNLVKDMTADGLKGVSQHNAFDMYWPGSTETCLWKNTIAFLTEAASCQLAKPIYIEKNELRARGKGISEYKKGVNFLDPWPGGWWGLSDLVQYEISSTMSMLKTASLHKDDILKFRADITKKQVKLGKTEAPYYYIFPKQNGDAGELAALIKLMKEHGVRVYELKNETIINNKVYKSGDVVIPLDQPFRAFIKESLEAQEFPERHYTPNGELIRPYDITTWSLPLHRGINYDEINSIVSLEGELTEIEALNWKTSPGTDFKALVLPAERNESVKAVFEAFKNGLKVYRTQQDAGNIRAGSYIIYNKKGIDKVIDKLLVDPIYLNEKPNIEIQEIKLPKLAIIESWAHDMDAGWTRFVLDEYGIPYKKLRPADIPNEDLTIYDAIIFPSENKDILISGKRKYGGSYYLGTYPPEYNIGMGNDGLKKVMEYVNNGGKIISWGESTELFSGVHEIKNGTTTEEFQLPFNDISSSLINQGLYVAGSLVQINLLDNHPLCYGLPKQIGVFYRGNPVFRTSIPSFDMDRRVIAHFPEDDILMSGYMEKQKLLAGNAAMVWIKKGEGQLVLYAFGPQFRASTQGSYKLLFNALFLN